MRLQKRMRKRASLLARNRLPSVRSAAEDVPDVGLLREAANRLDQLTEARDEALDLISRALAFFDRVTSAREAERIAVGHDHWTMLLNHTRRARAILAEERTSGGES